MDGTGQGAVIFARDLSGGGFMAAKAVGVADLAARRLRQAGRCSRHPDTQEQ
jgi:hypothetical protein